MQMQMQMQRLLLLVILCCLLHLHSSDPNHISINCGGAPASTSLNGRPWGGDALKLKLRGSSTAAVKVEPSIITAVDPVPYGTARVSRSQFSYSFQLTTPGQKFIRLHFNPVSYHGFESFTDFFTVEAGPFTLLANFSASITARALSLNVVVKEFCIIIQQNQPLVLDIVFSPETRHNYAFVNGIEIISVPSTVSYCHGGDSGVDVLGQKSVIFIDNDTVLQRVYQHNIKWGSVSFVNDIGGMFGIWASILHKHSNKATSLSFGVSVDVGFRYLVRVHLCEVGLLKTDFMLMIDNILALTSADIILHQSENRTVLWYNYMVMVQGKKREGNKHTISISLHSQNELVDRQGPLEGFEVFKLSNHDFSLSTPNPPLPLPPKPDSSPHYSIPTLLNSLFGRPNAIATLAFTVISVVNIILHLFQNMWGTYFSEEEEEENEHLARPKQPCRRFTLAEIQSATENFHSGFFIGKGGFGNVYKGFIDNGREIVAIKRLKPDSNQGEQQFWTEVEMLSELRHVNLVSLLGFCIEQQEMMLVYEFMPSGTLADHLFKYAQKSHDYIPLSWKQRLKICIGAGRALDYLHTGHGIIHRDVKSSNILLDERFVAKVSDFGLAKPGFGSESQSQHSTLVKGTHGYLDPYYCETHKPTKNSDTYSFGVVLLEVLCGRRALERHTEEDKCRLTTWAIDYISKGQVYHIVFPSLIKEISPDSLKTFVRIAKRCLHDEPKKRPAIGRVVMKLELALQQQEKAESPEPNERNSVEDWFPTTGKYQKEKMNFTVPNEKINIVDTLPQMERRNVTDAISCAENDRTVPRAVAASSYPQTVTSLPFEQNNSTLINDGREKGRKSLMLRISQILWPWDAFWNTRKSSNKTNVDHTSVSAPIIRRTSNIKMDGNTITNRRSAGMILTPIAESSDKKEQHSRTMGITDNISNRHVDDVVAPTLRGEFSTERLRTFVTIAEPSAQNEIRNVTDAMPCADNDRTMSRPMTSSSNPQIVTSPPFEKINSTMIHSGRKGGRRSTMLRISQKLWPWDAFSKTKKPANKTNSIGTSVSVPIPERTGNKTMNVLRNQSAFFEEESNEKEQHSQTVRVMDNIRKGQVDHIVAPTMRGEYSPDSMKKLIDISETCLHDETKNQPTTMHIATDIKLALQQLVIPESLPPKGGTIVKGVSSSAGKYQRENMNLMASNEKINVNGDVSPCQEGQMLPHPNLRDFTLAELKVATRNFRSDSVLGEGGFGKVYKGKLDDKVSAKTTIVAVKKLNSESIQGLEEWKAEVNFLGRLSHPNLVRLLGYCSKDKEFLLVYEFMPKGSLENHLFGRGTSVQPLTWDIRLKILIGAARGLAFLHASAEKVIYRDFKPSNILLDGSYEAKLSDFGLAKRGPEGDGSHVTTRVMGTHGYAAPEYIATGHLYAKSDVYGFGVVLVEMLTGLRALDAHRPLGQQILVDWIKPYLSQRKKVKRIIDVRLEGQLPTNSALHIAQLALTCLENEPKNRPSMQEIVETLERSDCAIANAKPKHKRSVHFNQ